MVQVVEFYEGQEIFRKEYYLLYIVEQNYWNHPTENIV